SDDLNAVASGSNDADGEAVTYEYNWFKRDGATWVDAAISTATVPAASTSTGEQWKFRARAVAGGMTSAWGWSNTLTISKTVLTAPKSVTISPVSPVTDDDLIATATGATGGNGAEITYEYRWSKRVGSQWTDAGIGTTTLSHDLTTKGERWRVEARAVVGGAYSGWVASVGVVIHNSVPTAPLEVTITPAVVRSGQTLVAVASGSTDADGDTITYRYAWEKSTDGVVWTDGPTTRVLGANALVREIHWRCKARASDVASRSDWTTSDEVIVHNGTPTAPTTVTVTPANPTVRRSLTATATGATDPDNDPLTYRYQWWQSTDSGTTWTEGATARVLNQALLVTGNQWKVAARASDGTAAGPWTFSAPVTIGSTAPAPALAATASASGTRDGAVQITVNLTAAAAVMVRITNMAGYEIAVLSPKDLEPGISTLHWNGRSKNGTLVPRGRYLAELQVCASNGDVVRCSAPVIW
ncbi:MAG TPA: FlgD immunoglobulin-like domain containing protein, partial [Propionicimonas sp.]